MGWTYEKHPSISVSNRQPDQREIAFINSQPAVPTVCDIQAKEKAGAAGQSDKERN